MIGLDFCKQFVDVNKQSITMVMNRTSQTQYISWEDFTKEFNDEKFIKVDVLRDYNKAKDNRVDTFFNNITKPDFSNIRAKEV